MPASLDALRRVLAIPRVLAVSLAFLLFTAAEFGTWVAILVYAYGATGPLSVGIVALVQLVPAALIAPIVPVLSERHARERGLLLAYALLGCTLAASGAAILGGAPPLLVYLLATLTQIAYTPVRPIQAALLPRHVGTAEQLTATNALVSILDGVGQLAGPLVAGIVLALAGPGYVFVAGGLASLVGAGLVLAGAGRRGRDADHADTAGASQAGTEAGGRLLDGVRSVARHPGGRLVIVVLGIRQVTTGMLDVLLVVASIELLGMGEGGAGYLCAALGLGMVLGGGSALALVGRPRLSPFLFAGALVWALFSLLVAAVPVPTVAVVLFVGGGIGLALLEVAARTLLQRLMPLGELAGAFGVVEAVTFGGLAVGAVLAGPAIERLGIVGALAAVGLLIPVATALVLPTLGASERTIALPLREIGLLRRLRLFAPVAAPQLETSARRLVPVAVDAGEAVIREGEPGDAFYVIASGRALVERGGTPIRELGPGEGFGEIALIRRVPRTATVTALTPLELLALGREDFLLAITGSPGALDEAERLADRYLGTEPAR